MTRASDTARLVSGGAVFNEASNDVDFRVESNGNANMLVVDAGNDRVGVGTNTPGVPFVVSNGTEEHQVSFASGEVYVMARNQSSYITQEYIANVHAFTGYGDSSSNEAMRIDSSGNLIIGKTSTSSATAGSLLQPGGGIDTTRSGSRCFLANRLTDDGTLIDFQQANSVEGSISVSGSTVSYNGFSGLHESSGIATDTPIGTVVSTIDELDVYYAKQGETANEEDCPKAGQTRADHAKVEVSDTVGDNAVYGVVGSFNAQGKVNVVSVGVGSVRVTGSCAKGDLLESNGDGTAKVQSDDIVRSKTIGKVTIGNSNTGVKLVSCVLYCG